MLFLHRGICNEKLGKVKNFPVWVSFRFLIKEHTTAA